MKILLVNSPLGRTQPNVYPLGLAYLVSALKDHDVAGFDAALSPAPFQDLTKKIEAFSPDVIGISLRNIDTLTSSNIHSYFLPFAQFAKQIKERYPDIPIIVGGSGFSLFGQEVMERVPEIDFGILLEGERSFPQLLDHLDGPENVRGVYYRAGDEVTFTGTGEPLDFGETPIPDRSIFDVPRYRHQHSIGVQTKRGCVFECLYCTYPYLTGRNVRVRPSKSIGEELEMLHKKHGVREVYFTDNVFNFPLEHAAEICQQIIDRKLDLTWTAYFSEKYITRDFIKLAKESGCVKFTFAPDGSNDQSLRYLGKGITRQNLEKTYELLEELGAAFSCSFIWNQPGTKTRDMGDLLTLVFRLIRMKNLEGLGFTAMRILPQTKLYGIAVEEGYIAPEDRLIEPVYYDPPPWNVVTGMVKLLRKIVSRGRDSVEPVAP